MKNWPHPALFAHRGGGSLAPENTMAAMKTGNAHGYGAVEFDVKLAKDNVALLMHDATLERTTNGRGPVCEKSMAELEIVDAGAWCGEKFLGERIPRFDAISNYLQTMGMTANVEIKPCPGREVETGRVVAQRCEQLWRDELVKPLVSSFSIEALRAARDAVPNLLIGLLVKIPEASHLALLEELGGVSMHCHHEHVTPALVCLFHQNGYRVMVYTVNAPDRVAALLEIGVDGMFTDNLAVMAAHFPLLLSRPDKERV